MSFCVELNNIFKVSRKNITDKAIKSFEDSLKRNLLSQNEYGVNKGIIDIRNEKNKEWYVNLKNILNSENPPSDYYFPNSDIVYDFIIKNVLFMTLFPRGVVFYEFSAV